MKRIVKYFILIIIFMFFSIYITKFTFSKEYNKNRKVTGIYTYKNCCKNCIKKITSFMNIYENCISDPNCAKCLDECGQELKINNEKEYNQVLKNTIIKEIF